MIDTKELRRLAEDNWLWSEYIRAQLTLVLDEREKLIEVLTQARELPCEDPFVSVGIWERCGECKLCHLISAVEACSDIKIEGEEKAGASDADI